MAEPFKNLLGPAVVDDLTRHLQAAGERLGLPFAAPLFRAQALDGLDALEMKARAQHLCGALEAHLPASFDAAAELMEAALATMGPIDDRTLDGPGGALDDGLSGWAVWPLTEYVARHGLPHTPRALQALHAMTQRFTGEWALRPFLLAAPAQVFDTLARWRDDPSPHVRRLVSEGSRPRLPWGLVLKPLVADPTPTLPLLRALMDDPSPYVRRSVANHLNDIGKDHPAVLEHWLQDHLPDAPAERRKLLQHASRSLIKGGHAGVLQAWGLGTAFDGAVQLALSHDAAVVGEVLTLTVSLRSRSTRPQRLAIDYAVHHRKANGSTSPKVFKGWSLELAPGATRQLIKRHSLKEVTTRRYHAGEHRISVLVNGQPTADAGFQLSLPSQTPSR